MIIMEKHTDFEPTSKRFDFIDRYQKAYRNTGISYQFGRVNGKKAIQFFYEGELVATRFKTQKYRDTSFDIAAYGGQDMNSAQNQREECLQTIVKRLFEKYGCKSEFEPNLGNFTPDVIVERDNFKAYIELKAFHKYNICGDPEIAQTMKYFEMASRLVEEGEGGFKPQDKVPRAILLTTGSLLHKNQSCFTQDNKKDYKYVKKFYKKRIAPRRYVDKMDKFTSKMMNIHAHKKFKRNCKIGLREMNVLFPEDIQQNHLLQLFFDTSQYEVLIVNYKMLYELLKRENLTTEAHYLKLIREAKLEKLVLNRDILDL